MRRILVLITVVVLTLLCACSAITEREYLVIEDYDAQEVLPQYSENSVVSSYAELNNVINSMISNRQETVELQFSGYEGNISDDIASACWQAKAGTALGSYMVDYISYDISRIVSYYQATVYVNYKRSLEALEAIESIGANRIEETVLTAVSEQKNEIAIALYSSTIDASAMAERVNNALVNISGLSPVIPKVSVDMYSGESFQHIFDVQFDYGYTRDEILAMKTELDMAVYMYASRISAEDDYSIAMLVAEMVADSSAYNSEAELGSAYDVLVHSSGDSRAFAVAFSAIANKLGLETQVVSGLKDSNAFFWNLVKIDEQWYHIDVLTATGDTSRVILLNDSEMSKNYRWNELDYPSCDGTSFVVGVVAEPSQAPEPSEEPEITEEELINEFIEEN